MAGEKRIIISLQRFWMFSCQARINRSSIFAESLVDIYLQNVICNRPELKIRFPVLQIVGAARRDDLAFVQVVGPDHEDIDIWTSPIIRECYREGLNYCIRRLCPAFA